MSDVTMPSHMPRINANPNRPPIVPAHQGDEPGPPPNEMHNERETPHPPTPRQAPSIGNNHPSGKRANIIIATLNVNGARAPTANMNFIDKWSLINCTIRTNKIALLALQETHLDKDRVESIRRCFGNSFELTYSSDPDRPAQKPGWRS
jgi:hypothetical protein